MLYRESDESIARRAREREQRRLAQAGFQPPKSKSDKRARRLIQALGDFDAT
jgi:ribosome-associated heat shock protein Hsp15